MFNYIGPNSKDSRSILLSHAHCSAAALVTDDEIAFFMADAFEIGDTAYIAKALGVVARPRGWQK